MLVLLPITLDRLVAVAAATRYRAIMTRRVSVGLVVLSWAPSVGFTLNHWILVLLKRREVNVYLETICWTKPLA